MASGHGIPGDGEPAGDWQAMLTHANDCRATPAGGLRITFDHSVDVAALATLVAAEQRCCAFYTFAITIGPDGTALDVRALQGAEAMIEQLFGVTTAPA